MNTISTPHLHRLLRLDAARRRRDRRNDNYLEHHRKFIRQEIQRRVSAFCIKHKINWSWLKKPDWKKYPSLSFWIRRDSGIRGNAVFLEWQKDLIGRLSQHLAAAFKIKLTPHKGTRDNWIAFNIQFV